MQPQGAQRGTEVSVRIHGQRVKIDPRDLLFYEPGIELTELKTTKNEFIKAKLRISPDCPLGPHALRLRTARGLSNAVTFHIGSLPEVEEQEPNNAVEQAQQLPFGSVINGVVNREDLDCFAFEVEQGRRFSVEVEGLRLGRTFFDPAVEVIGPDGAEVARSDDSPATLQDPSLSFTTAEPGRYVVRIREAALRGSGQCSYRLHVGDFARPSAVFPTAVELGAPTELAWIGAAAGPPTMTTVPAEQVGAAQVFPGQSASSAPTGLWVQGGDRPVALEAEPNNGRGQATPFEAPAACVGVIGEPGDIDFYRFSAKKGQALDIRVHARSLRSPLDSVLRIFDSSGKRLAGNDDDRGKPDSYLRFRTPADGEYLLQVSDQLARGGPDRVYAVEVSKPSPEVALSIHEQRRYVATTIDVPRGNRMAVLVNARRNNFGGALNLDFQGLPKGVTFQAPRIEGFYFRTPVVFSAAESTGATGALAEVTARRTDGEPVESVFSQQEWQVRGRNNVSMCSYFGDRAPVAVTAPAPVKIRLAPPKGPIVQSGSKKLKVIADRAEGFEAPVSVRMLYHPPGLSSNRSRSIRKGESEAVIPVTANARARSGEWDIVVVGEINLKGRVMISTQLVKLRVATPHLALSLPRVSVQQGKSAEYVVGIDPHRPFNGAAKFELLGLPPGVTTDPIELPADAKSATFQLSVAGDARVGRHRSLACRVTLSDKGEPVVHTRGGGELLIDPLQKKKKAKKVRTASREQSRPGGSS